MGEVVENKGNFSMLEAKENSFLGFPDITLRTMKSDLEAIQKSGGSILEIKKSGIPVHVTVSKEQQKESQKEFSKQIEEQEILTKQIQEKQTQEVNSLTQQKTSIILKIILAIIILGGFFSLGYFVLPKILSSKVSQNVESQITTTTPSQAPVPIQNQEKEQTIKDSSTKIFKVPQDQILVFNINPQAPNFNKYLHFLITDYFQKLKNQTTTQTSTNFWVINILDQNNNAITWQKFLEAFGINLINSDFWQNNFKENFEAFVYKDKNNFLWPGYVLEVKPSVLITNIQIKLRDIEKNKNDLSRFYINPTDFSEAEFQNVIILSREPARILKAKSGENFVYGIFFSKYLILSTSKEGLEEAIKKM